jgi:hypothetical protein
MHHFVGHSGYQLTATSYGRPAMSCEVVAPATETQDVLWPATALNAARADAWASGASLAALQVVGITVRAASSWVGEPKSPRRRGIYSRPGTGPARTRGRA